MCIGVGPLRRAAIARRGLTERVGEVEDGLLAVLDVERRSGTLCNGFDGRCGLRSGVGWAPCEDMDGRRRFLTCAIQGLSRSRLRLRPRSGSLSEDAVVNGGEIGADD